MDIALKFGTLAPAQVLEALRVEHWLYAHPGQLNPRAAATMKRGLREAFFVERANW